MSQATAIALNKDETLIRQWLALALTPGLGANKSRRLVEFFGGVQAVFKATLTELEAAGIARGLGAIACDGTIR